MTQTSFTQPSADCPLCPRLAAFREANRAKYSHFHNAPVPAFGNLDAELLVVGLAPGLKGANATGRPFTGDYAGDILYAALEKHGLATGHYQQRPDDGFSLINTRVTNGVRCVPPENKPETSEIHQCNSFLRAELAAMPNLKVILSLGSISHNAVLRACSEKLSHHKFAHQGEHTLHPAFRASPLLLVDSYHTSRYNLNTGVLTVEMFDEVVKKIIKILLNINVS